MSKAQVDALIVGAGPVGLTAAVALLHHGVTCRIIEKTRTPSDKSKALVVWCRTLELLDQMGLAPTFLNAGMKLNGGSMYANGQRLVHLDLSSDDSPYGFPLMIPQNETERLLTEHLASRGITIERSVELLSFAQNHDSVVCDIAQADGSKETVTTNWLIGCDGAHSTVRHTLGMDFVGEAEPNDWMLADVHIHGPLAGDEVSVFWSENGVLAFFPINRDRFRMIADLGSATEKGKRPDPTLADVQARIDERGPGGLTCSDPVWLANFRINERKVADYRKGRVLLAGDAAHIHSPAGGQGMNTGMQDSFNLAWKIALIHQGKGLTEPLLNSYSVERSAVGDQVLNNAARFTTVATLRNPAAQWLRNHVAPIIGSFQFARDKVRDEWFELSINYRHSPLSAEKWPWLTSGVAAGDRLGDARLTSASDGSFTTLFEALRGSSHKLLLLPGADEEFSKELLALIHDVETLYPQVFSTHLILKPDNPPLVPATEFSGPVWIDTDNRLHHKLHVKNQSLFVVRPDGYLGYRCQPASREGLLNYLQTYLIPDNAVDWAAASVIAEGQETTSSLTPCAMSN